MTLVPLTVAVATRRTERPRSLLVSFSHSDFAPRIAEQVVFVQRCHAYETRVGEALQVGGVAVSVRPTTAKPAIVGGRIACGAVAVQLPDGARSSALVKGAIPVELT